MRVLEYKHLGPFDGCFWRWEYLFVEGCYIVTPIVFTPSHLSADGVVALALGKEFNEMGPRLQANLFTEFQWYDWGLEIFQEISHAYIPAFWKFAQQHNLVFLWVCDECGEAQDSEPMNMAGYHGNGGIGIEVDGWLCADCAYKQEERYNECYN